MKVVTYLQSAQETKSSFYRDLLLNFSDGIKKVGDDVVLHDELSLVEDDDVAIIFGSWKSSPQDHHYLKNKIYSTHGKSKSDRTDELHKKMIVIETPLIGRTMESEQGWWRVGINHFLYDMADFNNVQCPDDRWNKMTEEMGVEIKPWRASGNHILLMLQLPKDASLRGMDISSWAVKTVHQLRKYTNRPIWIRPHPTLRNYDWGLFDMITEIYSDVHIHDADTLTLEQSFDGCHAVVSYTSGSSVDAIINGVPVFVCDTGNMAFPMAEWKLENIETPLMPDRTQYLNNLAYAQWSISEMKEGLPWLHLKPKLDQPYKIKIANHPLNKLHPKEEKMNKIAKERKLAKAGKKKKKK